MAVNPMMESVMSAGVNGMHAGIRGMATAAQEIAELNTTARDGGDAGLADEAGIEGLVDALTSLKIYERQVQASARVVETADEVVGFLLDVHA